MGLKAACIGPALSKFCPSVGDGSTYCTCISAVSSMFNRLCFLCEVLSALCPGCVLWVGHVICAGYGAASGPPDTGSENQHQERLHTAGEQAGVRVPGTLHHCLLSGRLSVHFTVYTALLCTVPDDYTGRIYIISP